MSLKLQWALGSIMVLAIVLPGQAANQADIGMKQQVRPLPAPQPSTPVMQVKPNQGLHVHVLGGTGKREVVVPMSAVTPGGVGTGKREVVITMVAVGPDGVGMGRREVVIPMVAVGPGGVGTGKREIVIPMTAAVP